MVTLQDRERGFEAKHARDEEFRFLVTARRDKLIAEWAAARLGLDDMARAELARAVLAIRDGAGHDEQVLDNVAKALAGQGARADRAQLQAALDRCAAQARQQLIEHPPPARPNALG